MKSPKATPSQWLSGNRRHRKIYQIGTEPKIRWCRQNQPSDPKTPAAKSAVHLQEMEMAFKIGNGDNNIIFGTSSDDQLWGMQGDDVLIGGGGNDTLNGGSGADTMDGGTGDDTSIGHNGHHQDGRNPPTPSPPH